MRTENAIPQRRTTKTPPMLSTFKELALDVFVLSRGAHVSWFFPPPLLLLFPDHHLSYSIAISPFSCSSNIANEILSRHGEPFGVAMP